MIKSIKIIIIHPINLHLQTNQFNLLLKIHHHKGNKYWINSNNNNCNSSNLRKSNLFNPRVLNHLKISVRKRWMEKNIFQKKWVKKNINYICKPKWINYKIIQLKAIRILVGITLMLAVQLLKIATATIVSVLLMKSLPKIQQSKKISKKLIRLHRNSLSPIQVTILPSCQCLVVETTLFPFLSFNIF